MLTSISGEVDEAKLSYILRDFDLNGLEKRKILIDNFGIFTVSLAEKRGE